jgi:hypothetical protein
VANEEDEGVGCIAVLVVDVGFFVLLRSKATQLVRQEIVFL